MFAEPAAYSIFFLTFSRVFRMFAEPAAYSLSDTYHLPIAYIPLYVY